MSQVPGWYISSSPLPTGLQQLSPSEELSRIAQWIPGRVQLCHSELSVAVCVWIAPDVNWELSHPHRVLDTGRLHGSQTASLLQDPATNDSIHQLKLSLQVWTEAKQNLASAYLNL